MKKQYETLKQLVEQAQGKIHADILALSEDEQVLLFQEALEEGTILAADEIARFEDDLEERIGLAKKIAALI